MSFNRNYQSLIALMPGVGRVFRPNSEFYNSQDSLDANSPSVLDLLQVMGGVESPVVVQNITESDAGGPEHCSSTHAADGGFTT